MRNNEGDRVPMIKPGLSSSSNRHSRSKSVDVSQLMSPATRKRTFERAQLMIKEISRQSLQPMDELVNELSRPRVDKDKESHRKLMRTVYTFEDWAQHRSTHRYLRHVLRMPSSKIVRSLTVPACFIASIVILIGFYELLRTKHVLPSFFRETSDTTLMLTLMGTALSLLLVFRTNASYTRWLDARKLWGLLTNRSRDLARQSFAYVQDNDIRDGFRRWIPAFSKAFKNHVRVDGDDRADLEGMLKPQEFEAMMAAKHKPLFALQVLAELLRKGNLPPPLHAKLDDNITQFEDILGASERILRTPIPLSYTRHTSRFMILWLLCLPFGLWQKLHWDALPATFIIAFMFLGIEEIGVLIEEPFSILPLERMCETIQTNIEQLYIAYTGPGMAFNDWVCTQVLQREPENLPQANLAALTHVPARADPLTRSPTLAPLPRISENAPGSPSTPDFFTPATPMRRPAADPAPAPAPAPLSSSPVTAGVVGAVKGLLSRAASLRRPPPQQQEVQRSTELGGVAEESMDALQVAVPSQTTSVLDDPDELQLPARRGGSLDSHPNRPLESPVGDEELIVNGGGMELALDAKALEMLEPDLSFLKDRDAIASSLPKTSAPVEDLTRKLGTKEKSVGDLGAGDNLGGSSNEIY